MTGRRGVLSAMALAALATAVPTAAAARSCSSAQPPTRATAWRAYVPAATPVRSRPTADARARPALTAIGAWRLALGATRTRHGDCLIKVRLTRRPNATHGWVAAARVRLARTRWRIEVDRAHRRVALLHAGRAVARWRVVVGKPSTPTPTGLFAVTASYRTPPTSFEGTWILALTAHSDALHAFDGGDGQVALHGRGGASLTDPLGTAASHGCVRLDNRAIGTIVARVGRARLPGVPVLIR
jgi:lipoprotein-anchoring transpeptidase ErfK/SrfK